MTLVLTKSGEDRPSAVEVADGSYIVGRGASAKIALPFPDVSERHALVMVRDGKAWVEDLKSANGTYVDGERIDRMTPLSDDSLVQIGGSFLRLTW